MSPDPSTWLPGIKPINIDDLERLGLDRDNNLHFDGHRVQVRQRLALTGVEKFLAALVSVAAFLGGVGALVTGVKDGSEFACSHGAQWACPIAEKDHAVANPPASHAPSAPGHT